MVVSNFGLMIESAQSSNVLIWVAIISASSAIISAVLVGYVNYRSGKKIEQQRYDNNDLIEKQRIEHVNQLEAQKIEHLDYQNKIKVFSQLMGLQHTRVQVYGAFFSAVINGNYYDLLSIINAISQIDYDHIRTSQAGNAESEINKIFVQERTNSMFYIQQKNERENVSNLMILNGKANERFWTIIGLIKVRFSKTPELDRLIKSVENALENFSRMNEKFTNEYNLIAGDIMGNARIQSNSERDDYAREWTLKINSNLETNRKQLIHISANFYSDMANLMSYLEREIN